MEPSILREHHGDPAGWKHVTGERSDLRAHSMTQFGFQTGSHFIYIVAGHLTRVRPYILWDERNLCDLLSGRGRQQDRHIAHR